MASVLKLRRDMVVTDKTDAGPAPAAKSVAQTVLDQAMFEASAHGNHEDEHEDEHNGDDAHHGPTFLGRLRLLGGIAAGVAALAAYPAMIVLESDTADKAVIAAAEPSDWTAPWAGAAAQLMEIHFDEAGWAIDAPQWAPAARLTGKPALQAAVAQSLGEFLTLKSREAALSGQRDSDLEAAARLLTAESTGVQMRAAYEALVSHDQRSKRYAAAAASPEGDAISELTLIAQWASASQSELAVAASDRDIVDGGVTRAVFSARGRAQAALLLIRAIGVHDDDRLQESRETALEAWRNVARFDPLLVLNAAPDSPLLGNHAAALGFLVTRAEDATHAYRQAAARLAPAGSPGLTNVVSASILAGDGLR
jgi:hypothetical protein